MQFCPGGELFDYIVAKERLKVWSLLSLSRGYWVSYSGQAMYIQAEVIIIKALLMSINLECAVLAFITVYSSTTTRLMQLIDRQAL